MAGGAVVARKSAVMARSGADEFAAGASPALVVEHGDSAARGGRLYVQTLPRFSHKVQGDPSPLHFLLFAWHESQARGRRPSVDA